MPAAHAARCVLHTAQRGVCAHRRPGLPRPGPCTAPPPRQSSASPAARVSAQAPCTAARRQRHAGNTRRHAEAATQPPGSTQAHRRSQDGRAAACQRPSCAAPARCFVWLWASRKLQGGRREGAHVREEEHVALQQGNRGVPRAEGLSQELDQLAGQLGLGLAQADALQQRLHHVGPAQGLGTSAALEQASACREGRSA